MRRPPALVALVCAAALGVTACGEDDEPAAEATPTPAATATATEAPTEAPAEDAGTSGADLKISKDTKSKPEIPKPGGDPPAELQTKDVVEGKGATAKAGSQLSMQYVGVSYSTGEEFDASWDRGEPFAFELGAGMVIPGWDEGIEGMKEGGRRLLVIPPDKGYGPQGTPDGSIAPNETLVFVVDLLSVG